MCLLCYGDTHKRTAYLSWSAFAHEASCGLAVGEAGALDSQFMLTGYAGLFPSAVQTFIVFPVATHFGVGGVGLGKLTPLFVIIFNTLGWSLPAYAWFLLAGMVHSGCCSNNIL